MQYGDAWNNLAAAHLHLKQKCALVPQQRADLAPCPRRQAFNALEQAARLKFESWKVWENYLITAMVHLAHFAGCF